MKGLKSKKGFTLIELLAVIVVLAIVMVLAVTTVLPYMNNAKNEAFALEANGAKEAASNMVSLILLGTESGADYTAKETGYKYCFDISDLTSKGVYEKDDDKYDGKVLVEEDGGKYKYTVHLTNGSMYASGEGNYTKDNVSSKKPDGWETLKVCAS